MKLNLRNKSNTFLLLLLSTDVIFIILHIIHTYTAYLGGSSFSIEKDRGYSEVFQYIKEYWIVLLLLYSAIKKRNLLYLSWSALFGYLLLDDSFQIHENLGHKASIYFDFSPILGLRSEDFGELTVSAFFFLCFFLTIGVTYYLSESNDKTTCRHLFLLLLTLVFFGVVVDMIHQMVFSSVLYSILGILEDGGEMLVMSVITWFVFLLPQLEKN
jgi:hypothetical protein